MSKLDRNTEINEKAQEKPGFRLNPNSFLGKIARPFALAASLVVGGASAANCTFDESGLVPPDRPDSRPIDDGSLDGGLDGGDAGDPDADASNPDADATPDPEICNDGIDNDVDGFTDCSDKQDCVGEQGPCGPCEQSESSCDDSCDNDGDNLVDCEDTANCGGDPACTEDCGDGIDNDSDGNTDCADHADCDGEIGPAGITCAATEIDCDDGGDNDADGDTDCDDLDCLGDSACPEICDNGLDDNGDGLTDCEAPECNGFENGYTICAYGQEWETDCTNGMDDNNNGETDCDDIACSITAACGAIVEDCNSFSADVNGDLLTKCEDVTCFLHDDCIDWDNTCSQSAGSLCTTGTSGQCGSGTCSEGYNFNGQSIPKTCSPLDQSCY
jgi:hypothetical protein